MTTEKMPLAQKLRPESLKDFVGQEHIVGKNKMLWRAIEAKNVGSCIFYGPPGSGKTMLPDRSHLHRFRSPMPHCRPLPRFPQQRCSGCLLFSFPS